MKNVFQYHKKYRIKLLLHKMSFFFPLSTFSLSLTSFKIFQIMFHFPEGERKHTEIKNLNMFVLNK